MTRPKRGRNPEPRATSKIKLRRASTGGAAATTPVSPMPTKLRLKSKSATKANASSANDEASDVLNSSLQKKKKKLILKTANQDSVPIAAPRVRKPWRKGIVAKYLAELGKSSEQFRDTKIPSSYNWKFSIDAIHEQQEATFNLSGLPSSIKDKVTSVRVLGNACIEQVHDGMSKSSFEKLLNGKQGASINGTVIQPDAIVVAADTDGQVSNSFLSDAQLRAACLQALDELIEEPTSESFRVPVDWKGMGLDDYPNIVSNPMDLGTIHSRLIDGEYDSSKLGFAKDAFEADVQLVFDNCHRYNKSGSDIYVAATELLAYFKECMRAAMQEAVKESQPIARKIRDVVGYYWENIPDASQARLWMWTRKHELYLVWSPQSYVSHPFLAKRVNDMNRMPIQVCMDKSMLDVPCIQHIGILGLATLHVNYLLRCQMLVQDVGKVLTLSSILVKARCGIPRTLLELPENLDDVAEFFVKYGAQVFQGVLSYYHKQCAIACGVEPVVLQLAKSKASVREFFAKVANGPETESLKSELETFTKQKEQKQAYNAAMGQNALESTSLPVSKTIGSLDRQPMVRPAHPMVLAAQAAHESVGEYDDAPFINDLEMEDSLAKDGVRPVPRPVPSRFVTHIGLPKQLVDVQDPELLAQKIGSGFMFGESNTKVLSLSLPPEFLSRVISVHALLHHFWFLWGSQFPTFKLEELVAALCARPLSISNKDGNTSDDVISQGSTLLMEQLHMMLLGFLANEDETFATPAHVTVLAESSDKTQQDSKAENLGETEQIIPDLESTRFTKWMLDRAVNPSKSIHATNVIEVSGQQAKRRVAASVSTFGQYDDNRAYTWQWKDVEAIGNDTYAQLGYNERKKPTRDYCSLLHTSTEAATAHILHAGSAPINSLSWIEYLCEYMSNKLGIARTCHTASSSKTLENYNLTVEEKNDRFLNTVPTDNGVRSSTRIIKSSDPVVLGSAAKAARDLVEVMFLHPLAGPFLTPVDSNASGLKSYPQIIKHPMDLGTVLERLSVNYYETSPGHFALNCFIRDMRRIWDNCLLFHKKTAAIVEDAIHLSNVFEERLQAIVELDIKEEELRQADIDNKVALDGLADRELEKKVWLDPAREPTKVDAAMSVSRGTSRRGSNALDDLLIKPENASLLVNGSGDAKYLAVPGPNSCFGKTLRPIPLVRVVVKDEPNMVTDWRIFQRRGKFLSKISVGAGRKHYVFLHPDGTRFSNRQHAFEYGTKTGIELELESDGSYYTDLTNDGEQYLKKYEKRIRDYQNLDNIKYKMELMLNSIVDEFENQGIEEVDIPSDYPFLLPLTILPARTNHLAGIHHLNEDEYFQYFEASKETELIREKLQPHSALLPTRRQSTLKLKRGQGTEANQNPKTVAKRGRGRPRKVVTSEPAKKRGRGRPRKVVIDRGVAGAMGITKSSSSRSLTFDVSMKENESSNESIAESTHPEEINSSEMLRDKNGLGKVSTETAMENTQAFIGGLEENGQVVSSKTVNDGDVGHVKDQSEKSKDSRINSDTSPKDTTDRQDNSASCKPNESESVEELHDRSKGGVEPKDQNHSQQNNTPTRDDVQPSTSFSVRNDNENVDQSSTTDSAGVVQEPNLNSGPMSDSEEESNSTPIRRSSRRSSRSNAAATPPVSRSKPRKVKLSFTSSKQQSGAESVQVVNDRGAPLASSPFAEAICLIEELLSHPLAEPFSYPVDTSLPELDGYLELVPYPIDLGTIQSNILDGVYGSETDFMFDEFQSDVVQVFHNCLLANEIGSPITMWSFGLHLYFEELLDHLTAMRIKPRDPLEYEKDSLTVAFEYSGALSRGCDVLLGKMIESPIHQKLCSDQCTLVNVINGLKRGEYLMGIESAQPEIGYQLAVDVRSTLAQLRDIASGAIDKEEVDKLTMTFNSEYHHMLGSISQSKWPWVGETILWYDSRAGKEGIKSGVIKDYYALPRYRISQMKKRRTDFGRLRVLVDGERSALPLNLWTPATADVVNDLMSFPNLYLTQWAFAHDPSRTDFVTTDPNAAAGVEPAQVQKSSKLVVKLAKSSGKSDSGAADDKASSSKGHAIPEANPVPSSSMSNTVGQAVAAKPASSDTIPAKYHTIALRSSKFNQTKTDAETSAVRVRRVLKSRERYSKKRDAKFGIEGNEILNEKPGDSGNYAPYDVPAEQVEQLKVLFPSHWEMQPVKEYWGSNDMVELCSGIAAATPYSSIGAILDTLQNYSYNALDPCDRLSLLELLCEQVLQVPKVRDSLMTENEIEMADLAATERESRSRMLKAASKRSYEAKKLRSMLDVAGDNSSTADVKVGTKRPRGRPPKPKHLLSRSKSSVSMSKSKSGHDSDEEYSVSSGDMSDGDSSDSDGGVRLQKKKSRISISTNNDRQQQQSQGGDDEDDLHLDESFRVILEEYLDGVAGNFDAPETMDNFESKIQDLLEALPVTADVSRTSVPSTSSILGFDRIQKLKQDVKQLKESVATSDDVSNKKQKVDIVAKENEASSEEHEITTEPRIPKRNKERRSSRIRADSETTQSDKTDGKTPKRKSANQPTDAQLNLAGIIAERRRKAYRRRAEIMNRLDLQEYFAVPFKTAKSHLDKLFSDRNSIAFQTPVDADALGLTNYKNFIPFPMDLGTIKSKLLNGSYNTKEVGTKPKPTTMIGQRFLDDLELMVLNCCTYNQEDSPVHASAAALEAKANKLLGLEDSRFELQGQVLARNMVEFLNQCYTLVDNMLDDHRTVQLEEYASNLSSAISVSNPMKNLETVLEKLADGSYYEHTVPGESYPSPRFAFDMRSLLDDCVAMCVSQNNLDMIAIALELRNMFEERYVAILKQSNVDSRVIVGELVVWNQNAITTQTEAIRQEKEKLESILKSSDPSQDEEQLEKQLFESRDEVERSLKRGRIKSTRQLRSKQGERKKWTYFLDDGITSKSAQSRLTFVTDPVEVDIGVLVYGLDWSLFHDTTATTELISRFGDFVPVEQLIKNQASVTQSSSQNLTEGASLDNDTTVKRGRPTMDREFELYAANESDTRLLFKLQLLEDILVVGHMQREFRTKLGPEASPSVRPRVEPLGFDRHNNRYWFFGASDLDHTYQSRFVFVELSSFGRDYLESQINLGASMLCHCGARNPVIEGNRFERTKEDLVNDALGRLPIVEVVETEIAPQVLVTRDLLSHKESRLLFTAVENNISGDQLVGCCIRKQFGELGWFRAVVSSYDPMVDWYRVEYVDGGVEDLTLSEVFENDPCWVTLNPSTSVRKGTGKKKTKPVKRLPKRVLESPIQSTRRITRGAIKDVNVTTIHFEDSGDESENEPKIDQHQVDDVDEVSVSSPLTTGKRKRSISAPGSSSEPESIPKQCTCCVSKLSSSDLRAGNLFVYTGRAQLDELILSLNDYGTKESKLKHRLLEIYPQVVLAMKCHGAELATCQVPRLVIHGERWFSIALPTGINIGEAIVHSYPDVMDGSPVVTKLRLAATFASSTTIISGGLRESEPVLATGDIIIAVNNVPLAGLNRTQQATLMSNAFRGARKAGASRATLTVCRAGFHTRDTVLGRRIAGFDETPRASSSAVISTLRRSLPPAHAALSLLLSLEAQLWSLLQVEQDVIAALIDWRWLHDWGDWAWPVQRDSWIQHVTDLIRKIEHEEKCRCAGKEPKRISAETDEVSLSSICKLLGTLGRAYVSTVPNVHPYNHLGELSETLKQLLDGVSDKSLFLPNISEYQLEFESLLPEMPTEGVWLRELTNCRNFSQLSQYAFWLFVESAARFSSAALTSKHGKSRMLLIRDIRQELEERCKNDLDQDMMLWRLARERYQRSVQKLTDQQKKSTEEEEVNEQDNKAAMVPTTAKGRVVGLLSRIGIGMSDSESESELSENSEEETRLEHLSQLKLGDYRGVLEVRGHFRSELRTKDGSIVPIGRYDTALEAAIAYDIALRAHYGSKNTANLCNFSEATIHHLKKDRLPEINHLLMNHEVEEKS